MGSGAKSPAVGSFYGTGADKNVDTVGFRPRLVKVYNETGLCWAVWTRGMADDSAIKFVTDGTMSKITTNGIAPRANGFAFGADSDLNVADQLCYYEAHE